MNSKRKHILLPIHLSHDPKHTLRFALELFKGESCHFCLINTYQIPVSSRSKIIEQHDLLKEKSKEEVNGLLGTIPKFVKNEDYTFEGKIMVGQPFRPIRRHFTENNVFTMIIGKKRPSGKKNKILAEIFHNLETVPVLVLPSQNDFSALKKILIEKSKPEDFSAKSLAFIAFLEKRFKAEYSYQSPEQNPPLLKLGFGTNGSPSHPIRPLTNNDNPKEFDLKIRSIIDGPENFTKSQTPVLFT